MTASWHPLTISSTNISASLPPLLVSATFTSNSYSICLTDLTHVWSEALDRRAILRRSLAEDTSIDPSEDAEQFRLFLEKIRLGLEGVEKGISLVLSSTSSKGESSSTATESSPSPPSKLELRVTAILPKPLAPFEWPIHLVLQSQQTLTTQLTVPLLRSQSARLKELDSLVEILKEKDHVIQKLVDKLEATGAELGHIFPGAAGKGGRKIPRKLAEERVKGLGPFEKDVWAKETRQDEKKNEDANVKDAVGKVFSISDSATRFGVQAVDIPSDWISWWTELSDTSIDLTGNAAGSATKDTAPAERKKTPPKTQDEGDDDFQVQATPPSRHKSPAKEKQKEASPAPPEIPRAVIDDSTEEEGEDDLAAPPSQRSQVPDSLPSTLPQKHQPKKLGAIGGSKKAAKQAAKPEPELEPEPEPESKSEDEKEHTEAPADSTRSKKDADFVPEAEDDTATEDDDEPARPPPKKAKTPPPPPASKAKKGGLGKIGGKKKEATPPPPSSATAAEETPKDEPASKTTTPKKKLGHIGHVSASAEKKKKDGEGVDGHNDEDERGRTDEKRAEEEKAEAEARQVRETSTERADRKRAELKRQLEEKAKAPVKKKRKF